MNIPSLECANCGCKHIRLARYLNWGERLRGALGIQPFRCRACGHRFLVSIWLFGKLRFAKCPRCLGLELTTWSRRYYKVDWMKNFLLAFGAQKYRCKACRCNFVSFLPRKAFPRPGEQPDIPKTELEETDGDDSVGSERWPEDIAETARAIEEDHIREQFAREALQEPQVVAASMELASAVNGHELHSLAVVTEERTSLPDELSQPVQQELVEEKPANRKSRPRAAGAEKPARNQSETTRTKRKPAPEQASEA